MNCWWWSQNEKQLAFAIWTERKAWDQVGFIYGKSGKAMVYNLQYKCEKALLYGMILPCKLIPSLQVVVSQSIFLLNFEFKQIVASNIILITSIALVGGA